MKSFVITGTDTDVGKTFVSSLLMAGLTDYYYWKPIQSGVEPTTDSKTVRDLTGVAAERILRERYVFSAPLSPHAAARLEGRKVDTDSLTLPIESPVLVEGAGGVFVPLNDDTHYIDVFARWMLPVIVVTRSTLGTINHTLLTLEALRHRGIPILGCIVNGLRNRSNEEAISRYGSTEILGVIEPLGDPSAETMKQTFRERLRRIEEVLA